MGYFAAFWDWVFAIMISAPRISVKADRTMRMRKEFDALRKKHVVVGVPEKTAALGREAGESNAVLANIHENGSPARNIPPRPFLRPSLENKKKEIGVFLKARAQRVLDGAENAEACYTAVGLYAQSIVKAYLRESGNFTPLKAATLARRKKKGFLGEKPLIETGQLLNSINFDVRGVNG